MASILHARTGASLIHNLPGAGSSIAIGVAMSEVWRGPPIAANLGRKQPMIVTMPADSFTLRVSTPDDAAGVSSLLDASYSVLMATGYDAATLTAALPFMTKANPVLLSSGLYYIAEHDDGRLAGCGGWSLEPPGTGEIVDGLGHIRHLAVHPQSTGCGVGRAIKERCEATARAAGVARFKWYASLNAEGFYKALGFTTRGTVDTPKGGLEIPSLLMTRAIGED